MHGIIVEIAIPFEQTSSRLSDISPRYPANNKLRTFKCFKRHYVVGCSVSAHFPCFLHPFNLPSSAFHSYIRARNKSCSNRFLSLFHTHPGRMKTFRNLQYHTLVWLLHMRQKIHFTLHVMWSGRMY